VPGPLLLDDLTPDDARIGEVLALNEANVPAVGSLEPAKLARLVDMSFCSLVAHETDTSSPVLGFCIVLLPGADYGSVNYRWFSERYDDFVYLDRVAVAEQARGLGIGRLLYDEVDRRGAGRSWFTLEVNLEPRNDVSLAFHERLGFTEVGQQTTDYGFVVSMQARPLVPAR
jgi:uncharacterized protein